MTPGGEPGPSGDGGFAAAAGRYHLYVSYACPWAHRTLIYRKLKGLEEHISVSVVHPIMPPESWLFGDYPGSTPDHVHGYRRLADLYQHVNPGYDGVVTVPVLYDKERDLIVNNESSEIIRMFNRAFDHWGRADVDFYPSDLRTDIDKINAFVYEKVNNGVYKAGFATQQAAYEEAFTELFSALDELERPNHRGGLATVSYLGSFRSGVCRAFQVQPETAHRLPQPLGVHARSLPVPRDCRHSRHGSYKDPLLRQPQRHQSYRYRAVRARTRFHGTASSRRLTRDLAATKRLSAATSTSFGCKSGSGTSSNSA